MTAPAWVSGNVDIDGDAARNVTGTRVSADLVQIMTSYVRGRPALYLGADEIADRLACHVPAGNHDLIVRALEIDHAVVLVGPRGSGRETTGIAAMRRLHPGLPIRRLSLEDEDVEEVFTEAAGHLVRAADGGTARLGRCVEAVRASGGYLVVVAETAEEEAAGVVSSITLDPPAPDEVCRRHLDRHGRSEWRGWERIPVLLAGGLPADGRRLACLIERIAPGDGDLAARQAEVARAYRGWREELRRWFAEHRVPHERALLVAAAALSPAAEETDVYAVAALLARRLRGEPAGAGLAWCPTTGLHALLDAERDGDRLVFRRHGFADAVLRHTLADYPLARDDVLSWLAALPTDEAVRADLRLPLAGTFADLAADHDAADLVIDTARAWAAAGLPDPAFVALARTCLHPRIGGRVRRALDEWSRAGRTPQTLKLVAARVCEPLGQTYPSIALTRLERLADHGNAQVRAEAVAAAVALAGQGYAAEALAAALAWSAGTGPEWVSSREHRRRRRAGAALFLALARPEILADRSLDPRPGWRAALDAAPYEPEPTFAEAAWQWLDACLDDRRTRRRVVSILVDAARPAPAPPVIAYRTDPAGPTRAHVMIATARRWAEEDRADPVRRRVMEEIVVPLTRPWLLRWALILAVALRARFGESAAD